MSTIASGICGILTMIIALALAEPVSLSLSLSLSLSFSLFCVTYHDSETSDTVGRAQMSPGRQLSEICAFF